MSFLILIISSARKILLPTVLLANKTFDDIFSKDPFEVRIQDNSFKIIKNGGSSMLFQNENRLLYVCCHLKLLKTFISSVKVRTVDHKILLFSLI